MEATKFIEIYRKFYFEDNDFDKELFETYGIPKNINRTNKILEEYILNKISEGKYDDEAFAWKAGKAKWRDGSLYVEESVEKIWKNGNGGKIKINKNSNAMSRNEFKKHLLFIDSLSIENDGEIQKYFEEISQKINLYNFGSVNIINALFFLSKGAIPIYDYYAHVAIKSLHMNKSPIEVYVSNIPGKEEKLKGKTKENVLAAVNVLEEYMWLLKEVFPKEIDKDGMYISRELDQALWVYGHATKKFEQ